MQFRSDTTLVPNQIALDLDLDFETYEVYDIYRIEFWMRIGFNEIIEETADSGRAFDASQAVIEVPFTVVTPGVRPAPDIVTPELQNMSEDWLNESRNVIATHDVGYYTETEFIATPANILEYAYTHIHYEKVVDLIQPWTVGGDIATYCVWQNTLEEMVAAVDSRFTIWGRKRNADKDEFYAINYRRFA
jgi:hypothetical protein